MKNYANTSIICLGLTAQLWCANDKELCCSHNERDGVSIADVLEHLGNLDVGSAGRDVLDLISGYEEPAGLNQTPRKSEES